MKTLSEFIALAILILTCINVWVIRESRKILKEIAQLKKENAPQKYDRLESTGYEDGSFDLDCGPVEKEKGPTHGE